MSAPAPRSRRLVSVAVWSVIAAAFIGPGTVTTAAKAGTGFGYSLLWALLFSTLACLLLQEAAARLTVVSGRNLGEALAARYPRGAPRAAVLVLVLGAVVVGCAAYQAGNILGGVTGAGLILDLPRPLLVVLSGLGAGTLLWLGSPRGVALALSLLVALMGVAFLVTGLLLRPEPGAVLGGALVPSLPPESGLLALGLVGTTVVPYNLFLGSGLAGGQGLGEVRLGLAVSVLLGGLISMGVLVVGTAVEGPFSFEALAAVLAGRLGVWAGPLFACGLFAAGFSSAVTAPLAAAVTARSLFAAGDASQGAGAAVPESGPWSHRGWRYRGVWMGVLAVGLAFGVSGVKPVPVIVAAQAFNGVLLPLVAVFLLLAVNDRRVVGEEGRNGLLANVATAGVVLVTLVLGLTNLARAAQALGVGG